MWNNINGACIPKRLIPYQIGYVFGAATGGTHGALFIMGIFLPWINWKVGFEIGGLCQEINDLIQYP